MIKLLAPDMPTADELLPFLRRMDATKVYVNNGPLVGELEQALGRATGGHCVTTTNATAALELVVRHQMNKTVRNLMPPVVLVPTVTYVASAQAIVNAGCRPMICDVDAFTWKLEPTAARRIAKSHRIDAVMPVAAFGSPVDGAEWAAFAEETGIPVVIDAAGALTEQQPPRPGVTIVYSMHATKFWGAGEGGVICTASEDEAQQFRRLACFGAHGTNAKMSEYHAAVGLAAMLQLGEKHVRTMQVLVNYEELLPGALLCGHQEGPARGNWTLFPVLLPEGFSAEEVQAFMAARGIDTRRWYTPYLHEREEFQRAGYAIRVDDFEVADDLSQRLFGLPFHTGLTRDDVETVCTVLRELMA